MAKMTSNGWTTTMAAAETLSVLHVSDCAGVGGVQKGIAHLSAHIPSICTTLDDLPLPWGEGPAIAVLHRAGRREEQWDKACNLLHSRATLIEMNIFGEVDDGPSASLAALRCFPSLHVLRKHWQASGCPDMDAYLATHRVLYNALAVPPSAEKLAQLRGAFRRAHHIPEDALVIGAVTRPDANRLDYMLPALLPRLARAIPSLHLITREFPESLAHVLRQQLGQRYHNLGMTEDSEALWATYAAMDIFAHFSSMGESYGMAIAEAMQAGVPVVANATPGAQRNNAQAELILHEKTGFLVQDSEAAQAALLYLAQSPERRIQMGEAARERMASAPFSPASVMMEYTRMITDLARGNAHTCHNPSRNEIQQFLRAPDEQSAPLRFGSADAKRLWWKVRRRWAA
ncbi:MAG: glycosyltransferase family 4 protein [Alphaproteobacteria bacterium]|nr:glycosyltransferase family 4 protein [Alphaproteobacteria bacterium]